jgi:hypothetical protein
MHSCTLSTPSERQWFVCGTKALVVCGASSMGEGGSSGLCLVGGGLGSHTTCIDYSLGALSELLFDVREGVWKEAATSLREDIEKIAFTFTSFSIRPRCTMELMSHVGTNNT